MATTMDDSPMDGLAVAPFPATDAANDSGHPPVGTFVLSSDASAEVVASVAEVSTASTICSPNNVAPIGHDAVTPTNDAIAGRRSRKRPNSNLSTAESSKSANEINAVEMPSQSTSAVRSTTKTTTPTREENLMSWICMECKEAEASLEEDSELVLCEGSCNRPFHLVCVGLKEIPLNDWMCADCVAKRHMCSICQDYGMDQLDVFLCKIKGCGLFYHESCLSMLQVDIKQVERIEKGSNSEDGPSETIPEFKCPAHRCWTCTEEIVTKDCDGNDEAPPKGGKNRGKGAKKKPRDNAFGVKTGHLFKCMECCIAYHASCIPPFARFHELALLCHDHAATCKLPHLDLETSFQGELERAADKKLETMKRGTKNIGAISNGSEEQNTFFLGMRGDKITREEATLLNHVKAYAERQEDVVLPNQLLELFFCLPCDLKHEVYSKPPNFRLVQTLRYDPNNRPKRKEPSGEACRCATSGVCDDHCYNRIMSIECTGDASKGNKNPYWNCDVGPTCGNRPLGLRKPAKCKPQREQGKGWGLITLEALKKGDLVQEYVGEVIDENTKRERLASWTRDHPNDPNFYIMQLDAGWYIDARVEANLSRFINHSCEPNCVLRPVSVAGHTRNGIYAARDLMPGEFLSYDYQFDTKHGDKFICRCGSSKCRGTMKGGKQPMDQDEEQRTSKQALAAAKAREEKDRKYLEDSQRIKEANFSQVDAMVPGAEYPGESVALGPHARRRLDEGNNRVFLWRNCLIGGDFYRRAIRLEAARKRRRRSRMGLRTQIDVLSTLKKL